MKNIKKIVNSNIYKVLSIIIGTLGIILIPLTQNSSIYAPFCIIFAFMVIVGNLIDEEVPLEIKIKYFNKDITPIEKIEKGDWIDLRCAEKTVLKKGEFILIPLGVGMKLPKGYEAYIVPRGSTYKNFKVIQTNHHGVVDESYCGNTDQWKMPVYALKDTTIGVDERVCQFRIQKKMPKVILTTVEELTDVDRSGFGSTGVK